jgi:hypothetical protein
MSTTSFTPGPWHLSRTFLPGTPDEYRTVLSAPPPGFASGDEVAKFVHPRDADLIAAAPHLYEALEQLAGVIDAAGLNNLADGVKLGPTVWFGKAVIATTIARAALARARGKA